MAAAVAAGTPVAAPEPKAAPAVVEAPKPVAAEPKGKPEAENDDKPEGKTTHRVGKAPSREDTVAKFAKAMNAQAEKDGVNVDAPPEERRAKPGPKPGAKRESAKPEPSAAPAPKSAAQANPTQPEAEADDDAGEPITQSEDEDADTGKAEPRATHQLKAKARLRHGDVDKAIRLAFGDLKPEEFDATKEALAKKLGVGSKQWADFRHHTAQERAKSKQLEANATELSQRLQSEFTPMIQARKAYQAKDYPKAFELAFGEEINSFQRKALHQHLSQDPEATRTKQEIAELRAEVQRLKQPAQADPVQEQQGAVNRELQRTHHQLSSQTDDPEIAFFATKAAFVRRVVEIRADHYDPQSRTTVSLRDASDMARDELKRGHDEWRYDPNASGAAAHSSESPDQAGNQPVRTSPRARSPLPSQAAQAGGSTRSMTRDERIKAFASRM